MTTFKNLLCLSALGAIMAGPAFAGTIIQNASVSNQNTDFNNVSFAPPIAVYNGAQTLLSVEVIFEGTGNTTISATNNAATPQTFKATTSVDFFLTAPGAGTNVNVFTLTGTTGFVTLAGNGASDTYGPFNLTGAAAYDQIFTDATTLSAFTGAGNVTANMSTFTSLGVGGSGGNLTVTQATVAGGNFEVIYTFQDPTDVPEPVSMTLLGTGLLGLGFARLRRRRG
jgi:hypothetical protein